MSIRCSTRTSYWRHRPVRRNQILLRPFHTSHPNQHVGSWLVTEGLELSHTAFQSIHTWSHLSWAFSIPLTGVLFRAGFVPIQAFIVRRQKRSRVQEQLMNAWRGIFQQQALILYPPTHQNAAIDAERWVQQQLKTKGAALQRDHGQGNGYLDFFLGLSFIPIWVTNMDVMRRMAGHDKTLLATLFATDDTMNRTIIPAEPDLASEGMLWFPDLTMADPLCLLPTVWGFSMYVNWWTGGGRDLQEKVEEFQRLPHSKARDRLNWNIIFLKVTQVLCVFAGPVAITSGLSSGPCLYLLASSLTMLVQKPLVKKIVGLEDPIKPARPLKPKLKEQT